MASKGGSGDGAGIQGTGFPAILEQFNQTLEAILEMLGAIFPHVASLDEQRESYTLPPMTEHGQEILAEAFEAFEQTPDSPSTPEPDPPHDGNSGEPAADEAGEDANQPLAKAFIEAYEDNPEALRAMSRTFTALLLRPQRQQLLHGSLLTMVVGTLETAIAQVVSQHYQLHPDALPREEKEFSLAELAEFEDLLDAKELAVSRRVESLIRGGLDVWDKTFQQLLKIDASDLADDRKLLHEIIQRRHLVVHNAARVSRQYKSRVPDCSQAIGETLEISRDYLEAAVDAVAIFGTPLIFVSWAKWKPDRKSEVGSSALDIVLPQLEAGRNLPARCISATAEQIAESDHQRLALRVNGWQARKRLEGVESIRSEVEGWDTTALAPQFSVAQFALLDDFDQLFRLLPHVVDQGHLSPDDVRQWPLFKEAREQEAWKHFDSTLPPAGPDTGDDDRNAEGQDEGTGKPAPSTSQSDHPQS